MKKFGTNFRAISRKSRSCAKMRENLSARKFLRIRYSSICTREFILNSSRIVTKLLRIVRIISNHHKTVKNCEKHAIIIKNRDNCGKCSSKICIYGSKTKKKSVDMCLRPGKNMGGWVGFLFSGLHIPVTFLDKYPPGERKPSEVLGSS